MLSEFAGAAQSLGAGAILVNPWNITDMAAAIEDALTMSEQVMRVDGRVIQAEVPRTPSVCLFLEKPRHGRRHRHCAIGDALISCEHI